MQLSEVIPGFGVGGEWNRGDLANRLIDLWLRDAGTATEIAMLPWVRDGITGWDNPVLGALVEIAMTDTDLGKRVAGSAWINGSVGNPEWSWLTGLGTIASKDLDLARTVAGSLWITDPVTLDSSSSALNHLGNIAAKDVELARTVAGLPWFTDGVTGDEALSLLYLDRIASTDLGFARTIVSLPWFTNSTTEDEWATLHQLESIASHDLELARWLLGLPLSEYLENHLLGLFYLLVANRPGVVSQIMGEPWVEDGLDEEELALIVALAPEASDDTYGNYALFEALLEGYYTQSKSVSLPLTGDANIWVFQATPFSSGEDFAAVIEETVRTVEGFLGSPIPPTEIIVLIEVVPEDQSFPGFGGIHHGSHVKVNRRQGEALDHFRPTIIHELAHYYSFTPPWFNESFAHLMEGYVASKLGFQSMEAHRAEASTSVQRDCSRDDIATIRHSLFVDRHFRIYNPSDCTRSLGLQFLHHAFELMGEERIAVALRDLSALHETRTEAAKEAIFRTLLSNTHPDRQEEFRDLYRRLHGGPYADPDMDRSDDHGDSEEAATDVAAGQVVVGTLDYRFDFDYFRLQAQENQKFRFDVDHETLRPDNMMIFTSTGKASPGEKAKVRVASGPLVQWIAPRTGTYYFAVLNWRGGTGRYTLQITHVPDVPDDHGDDETTATDIAVGETVRGVIDDTFDLDYFRFPVVEGRSYRIRITAATLQDCCVAIGHDEGGFIWDGSEITWPAQSTRDRYLVVHGGHGNTGEYVLDVSQVSSE